jgi:hypothetical protein
MDPVGRLLFNVARSAVHRTVSPTIHRPLK